MIVGQRHNVVYSTNARNGFISSPAYQAGAMLPERGALPGILQLPADSQHRLVVLCHPGLSVLQGLPLGLGLCICILQVPAES